MQTLNIKQRMTRINEVNLLVARGQLKSNGYAGILFGLQALEITTLNLQFCLRTLEYGEDGSQIRSITDTTCPFSIWGWEGRGIATTQQAASEPPSTEQEMLTYSCLAVQARMTHRGVNTQIVKI